MLFRLCAVVAILTQAVSPVWGASGQPSNGPIGWVGLFDDELVTWLENENRLVELCSGFATDSGPWHSCREEKLSPKVHVVRLRNAPSKEAPHRGDLVVVALPGKGLRSLYVDARGGAATSFSPDLVDVDWGYGPYFHETVAERRGSWVRLPEAPFPKGTWLDTSELGSESSMLWLDAGRIVTSPFGDLYIIGVEKDVVRARPEQAGDMWCEGGPRPPAAPFKELRLGAKELYNPTGHLTLRIKYTRGC